MNDSMPVAASCRKLQKTFVNLTSLKSLSRPISLANFKIINFLTRGLLIWKYKKKKVVKKIADSTSMFVLPSLNPIYSQNRNKSIVLSLLSFLFNYCMCKFIMLY